MEIMNSLIVKWYGKKGKRGIDYWSSKRFEALVKFVESRGRVIEGRWDEGWYTDDKQGDNDKPDVNESEINYLDKQVAKDDMTADKEEAIKKDEL